MSDDLIFTGDFGIKEFRTVMESEFEMTDLGLMKFFWGIEVDQSESGILYHIQSMQVQF